jgi:hypothetical protein
MSRSSFPMRAAALGCALMTMQATAANVPLYVLVDQPTTDLGCWEPHFRRYDRIVGHSVLGHFFLRSTANNEYLVLHPFLKAGKSYGTFATPQEFEKQLLQEPSFQAFVLRPEHVQAVHQRVGVLEPDQIYIPKPYPMIGGSDAPETYGKGDVWVFMDIVSGFHGLCELPVTTQ